LTISIEIPIAKVKAYAAAIEYLPFAEHTMIKRVSVLRIAALIALVPLLVVGCSRPSKNGAASPDAVGIVPLQTLSEKQTKQRETAIATKTKLFDTLLKELMQAMIQPPLGNAIKVCKERAPQVAAEVSQETGVRIGRTSFKLRNQANQPPTWAKPFVEKKLTEEIYVSLPDNKLGALIPIRLQNTCLMCHGKQISNDLKAVILTHYPEDEATGFDEGDLRGYFWVEVPSL
jgi:hypothetical protein